MLDEYQSNTAHTAHTPATIIVVALCCVFRAAAWPMQPEIFLNSASLTHEHLNKPRKNLFDTTHTGVHKMKDIEFFYKNGFVILNPNKDLPFRERVIKEHELHKYENNYKFARSDLITIKIRRDLEYWDNFVEDMYWDGIHLKDLHTETLTTISDNGWQMHVTSNVKYIHSTLRDYPHICFEKDEQWGASCKDVKIYTQRDKLKKLDWQIAQALLDPYPYEADKFLKAKRSSKMESRFLQHMSEFAYVEEEEKDSLKHIKQVGSAIHELQQASEEVKIYFLQELAESYGKEHLVDAEFFHKTKDIEDKMSLRELVTLMVKNYWTIDRIL